MQENIDQNSWKYRIAEQIVSSYIKDCVMSKHIFEEVIIKQLLWHATTMIKGNKVNGKGELEEEDMINIKIVGQRYWSDSAIEEYKKANPENKIRWKSMKGISLRHEHVVPRRIIKDKIKTILDKKLTEKDKIREVYNIIDRFSKSVVVTQEENEKLNEAGFKQDMPDGWEWKECNIFSRYHKTGIKYTDLGEKVPYNKKFKDLMYNIKLKNNE